MVKLLSEGGVSSGVRRVEAVTGLGALGEFRRDQEVAQLAGQFAGEHLSPAEALRSKLSAQEEEIKKLRRELDQARMKSAASSVASAASQAVVVEGIQVLAQRVDSLDRGQLRTLVDNLRNKLGSGVVVLGSAQEDGKVALIAGVTRDLTGRLSAGKIIAPARAEGRRLWRRPARHGGSRRQRRLRAECRLGQRPRSGPRTARKDCP